MNSPLTGKRMTGIFVLFFGVVIAVNVVMAYYASSTFVGIVVENSYVASQEFNRWLDEAAAEKALGWSATVERRGDGRIAATVHGPGPGAVLGGSAWHPLGKLADRELHFMAQGQGRFISTEALPEGRWTLRLDLRDGTKHWRTEEALR